jgi:hypothetical protein
MEPGVFGVEFETHGRIASKIRIVSKITSINVIISDVWVKFRLFCLFFRQLNYSRKFDILKSDRLLVSLDLVPAPPLVQTYKEELSPRKVKLNGAG